MLKNVIDLYNYRFIIKVNKEMGIIFFWMSEMLEFGCLEILDIYLGDFMLGM